MMSDFIMIKLDMIEMHFVEILSDLLLADIVEKPHFFTLGSEFVIKFSLIDLKIVSLDDSLKYSQHQDQRFYSHTDIDSCRAGIHKLSEPEILFLMWLKEVTDRCKV